MMIENSSTRQDMEKTVKQTFSLSFLSDSEISHCHCLLNQHLRPFPIALSVVCMLHCVLWPNGAR